MLKLKNKKLNNRGFSLLELIIAVVILGIVVIPLLRAFTTSALLTTKAKNMGEATAAAQNIQETIESYTVANMFQNMDPTGNVTENMTNERVLELLGVESTDTTILSDQKILIKNVKNGNKTFNATVEFNPTSVINTKLIAQYTDMTGTFSQPYSENQNPDILADNAFIETVTHGNTSRYKSYKARDDGSDGFYRERSSVIQVFSVPTDPDDLSKGYDVEVYVNFIYNYWYFDTESARPTLKREWKTIQTYSVFPAGHHIDSFDDEVACYFMYYPFYENNKLEQIDVYIDKEANLKKDPNKSTSSSTSVDDSLNEEKTKANKDGELKFKLFVVKMWPMTSAGASIPANDNIITSRDHMYTFQISEYHNDKFNLVLQDNTHATEDMMNVYTNANVYLDGTGMWADYQYRIKIPSKNNFFYFYKDAKIKNQLVKTEKEDRYYNVTIQIFDANVDPLAEDAKFIYEMKASKLK